MIRSEKYIEVVSDYKIIFMYLWSGYKHFERNCGLTRYVSINIIHKLPLYFETIILIGDCSLVTFQDSMSKSFASFVWACLFSPLLKHVIGDNIKKYAFFSYKKKNAFIDHFVLQVVWYRTDLVLNFFPKDL